MILPKLSLRNLRRNPKNTAALVVLVAAGVLLFNCGEAMLGSAASGIQREYRDGYTGDLAVRARFDRDFGIFGFNVPVISEYETIPVLPETEAIRGIVGACPSVAASASMVSGAAMLETGRGYQAKLAIFGVDGKEYFSLFPSLSFVAGTVPSGKDAWIILPRTRVEEIEKAEGRKLEIGEKLQLVMAVRDSFSIRAVSLAAIVEPEAEKGEASLLAYTDPTTIRSLLGLSTGARKAAVAEEDADVGAEDSSGIEDLFASPAAEVAGEGMGLGLVSKLLGEAREPTQVIDPAKGAWHFLLAKSAPGVPPAKVIAEINAALRSSGIQAEAVGWLKVAGMNAGILFLLKTVFEIGMAVLAAIVVLVLANGLAFSVLEQTKEIGTMRAIGAGTSFVRNLFLLQSLYISLAGAALGTILSWALLSALGSVGIPIDNSYLLLLFGSSSIKPGFSPSAAFWGFASSGLVALASSAYPITLALRTGIVQTMEAE
jgi:ABC-type lipoprotein release transport system permease subunit